MGMKTITVKEAFDLYQENDVVIIDVREQNEFDEVHIEGAILCPLSTLPQELHKIDFDDYQDKTIIFQCLKGGRSAKAIDYAHDNILKDIDVYNLEGGISEWIDQDLPVIHGKS